MVCSQFEYLRKFVVQTCLGIHTYIHTLHHLEPVRSENQTDEKSGIPTELRDYCRPFGKSVVGRVTVSPLAPAPDAWKKKRAMPLLPLFMTDGEYDANL